MNFLDAFNEGENMLKKVKRRIDLSCFILLL